MFVRGQVQQQSTGDKLLGLFPAKRAGTVFREAVLDHISPSRTDTGGKLIQNQGRDLLEPSVLHKDKSEHKATFCQENKPGREDHVTQVPPRPG